MKFISDAKIRAKDVWSRAERYKNALIFLGGFIFDALTIKRIDALADLLIQIAYLICLTIILIYQHRVHLNLWKPEGWKAKMWEFNVEALHFFYGGLFSAYVILYLKSTSGARAVVFLLLLVFLMVINEMPQVRRFGYRLRLGLYAFCVSSFLIYFLPILFGRMGWWTFLLSMGVSVGIVWWVAARLAKGHDSPKREQVRLFVPAGALFIVVGSLYFMKLIPPVPLSVQYQGIFHDVEKDNGSFTLTYQKPPWYAFWRQSSDPFLAREGDAVHYFVRVFAPARFQHQVRIRWERYQPKKEQFLMTDIVPLNVKGGREKGFRGSVAKENYQPGKWRVSALAEDGRVIGFTTFEIISDEGTDEREWKKLKM